MRRRRNLLRRLRRLLATLALLLAAAEGPTGWQEPYGGCKEAALYVGTDGWWECLSHGRLG